MPRLSKIRITGNRYDGFQKGHEDSIFDLAADHSLFTLQNGSGKGVMLQLISQILLPGTSWGSNNGNKIEGMFYDRYNVFKPYTFHVVLEWKLDNSEKKRLLAGICVFAYRKKNLDDSEGKVGLKYFLYTHEYSGESRYNLDNLPLYSNSAGGVLDYDDMKDFIEENSQYIRKYSKSSLQSLNSDYYQYLSSHGIYRSEWEIMKTINRSEGGLEKYFSQARDNQALFEKLIIPAVSESISSRSGDNENSLLKIFVDNIKIAKNLPELISRTDDINILLRMVEPLLLNAEHGIKLRKALEMIRARGNNYLHGFKSRLTFLENELKRSKNEQERTKERLKELDYEENNLKYARKLRELKNLRASRSELEDNFSSVKNYIFELEKEEKELRLKQHFIVYEKNKNEYQQQKNKIKALKDLAGLSKLHDKIRERKEKIKTAWPELKKAWEDSSRDVSTYYKYLEHNKKALKDDEKEIDKKRHELEIEIDRYDERKREFEEWQKRLSVRFNPLQLSSPAYLLEELSSEIDIEKKKLNDNIQIKGDKERKKEELQEERGDYKIDLARKEENYKRLEKEYQRRRESEADIYTRTISILELDRFKEVYTPDWLLDKKVKMEKLLVEKSQTLQELNNKTHELELDLALNQKDYWIANYDQKRLHQSISAMNIRAYYGSDFLINQASDKEKLLEDFPQLPYGLVLMYEADWERLKLNFKEKDIFRSPVPIFINFQLEESGNKRAFKMVHGQELEFINNSNAFELWYRELDSEKLDIEKTIGILRKKINNISKNIYRVDDLLNKKHSAELKSEMEDLKEEINIKKEGIKKLNKKIEQLKEDIKDLLKRISKSEKQIELLKKDYVELKEFAEEKECLEKRSKEIERIKEELIKLEKSLQENKSKQEENIKLKLSLDNDYKNWLKDLELFLLELKEIIPGIEFVEKKAEREIYHYPGLYSYKDSRLYEDYQILINLEKEEEEKNYEIKYLRKELDRLRIEILKKEDEMSSLFSDWQTFSFESTTEQELKIKLESLVKVLNQEKEKHDSLKDRINLLSGEIKSKSDDIDDLYEDINLKFNKSARAWSDLDLSKKELSIKNAIEDNRSYLQKIADMIDEYKDKIKQLEILINKMEFYQLDADKGEINSRIEEEVRNNPAELVEKWTGDYQGTGKKIDNLRAKSENDFYKFKRDVNEIVKNDILRSKINERIIQDFHSDDYQHNQEMLLSFREYLNNELNRIDDDKKEAERAREQWAERSAMHVMRIISSLREMISNMVYQNKNGHNFPLVRLRRNDLLPESEEEIIPELKDYFLKIIAQFRVKEIDVDKLTMSELKEYSGDAALFSQVVRGRYPVLQVYKMTEKNEFQYARPEDYFYADWEAVIQGKGDTPEGSGGQSLSINAFMMMMLLNYKKQRLDKSNPWTVLFLDNPFGKASAAHVLDPVFEIANKLNFQIIAFAAPEIIKTEISERFPVFWVLGIEYNKKGRGIVNGQVSYGGRKRKT